MNFDLAHFIQITRTILTIILLFLITWYYEVPEAVWTLTTCTIVTFGMKTVGGSQTKAYLRFIGTLLSALYAILIVYTCGNNPIIDILALIPAAYLYGYYFLRGGKSYIGILGLATLTFVLLNYNDIENAMMRLINVVIGIIASLFMMRFFYPQYARDNIIITISEFMDMLSNTLKIYLDKTKTLDDLKKEYDLFENNLLMKRASFLQEMDEAKIETKKTPLFMHHILSIKTKLRHLHHLMSVLVLYATTDEVRQDGAITERIQLLLRSLQAIQNKLASDGPLSWPILNVLIKKYKLDMSKGLKHGEIHSIFEKMESEIMALNTEIEQLVLNHQVYKSRKESYTN